LAIDWETVERALWTWASEEVELETIWDRPNAPRPETPYVLLGLLSAPIKHGSKDDLRGTGTEDEFEITGQRSVVYSVKVIGKNAIPYCTDLQISLEKPSVQEALRVAGLAVWNIGDVENIATLLETGFEERANMDVTFGISDTVAEAVGEVQNMEGTGEITLEDGTTKAVDIDVTT
jgi:hypothetical protein